MNMAYSVDNTEKHEKLSEGPVNDCTFVLTVNRCRSRMIGSRLERYDTMVSKNNAPESNTAPVRLELTTFR